ncbi:MAG: ATP-binding protein [Fimbriimonadaceae bacterium]
MDTLDPEVDGLEGHSLELKSAFTWNARVGHEDGALREGVAKTIAAFSNSHGGRLIIGADEGGHIHGIDSELHALFEDNHMDQFESLIHEYLKNLLHPYPFRSYSISFEKRNGLYLCDIIVAPSPGVTYLRRKTPGGAIEHELFVRTGNRSIRLVDVERDRFLVERFGGNWPL